MHMYSIYMYIRMNSQGVSLPMGKFIFIKKLNYSLYTTHVLSSLKKFSETKS